MKTNSRLAMIVAAVLIAGCSSGSYQSLELSPPPVLYTTGAADPFENVDPGAPPPEKELLYVTGRRPAGPDEPQARYADARAPLLRAGAAVVAADPPFEDFAEIRAVTVGDEPGPRRDIVVSDVREIGVLPAGITEFHDRDLPLGEMEAAGAEFARRIDEQLADSGRRDVFIFVHGYNVNFEYPLLVAKEWQHYLAYEGAFLAFAWPATPSRYAYFKDIETAEASVRDLRVLLEFLAERTSVERIHLFGYSAGSRLVLRTLHQTALMKGGDRPAPRLGQVIFVGSDVDPKLFLQVLADGALDVADRVLVYMSASDSALSMSELLLGRRPLGASWEPAAVPPDLEARLAELDRLELIDVTGSDDAHAGNGHWYFRGSPWVRSDLITSLLTREPAATRGLVRPVGSARWRFPPDYPERLAQAAEEWRRER